MRVLSTTGAHVLANPGEFARRVLSGFKPQPGPAAGRRGGLLRAAVGGAAADPGGDRAVAPGRPGRTARHAGPLPRLAAAGPVASRSWRSLPHFVEHRDVVGWLLLGTMLFFSSLAFTVLEKAMSVIFLHRVDGAPAALPDLGAAAVLLHRAASASGLLVVTLVSGSLAGAGPGQRCSCFGREWSLSGVSGVLLYLLGLVGEIFLLTSLYMVMPVGRLTLAPCAAGRRHGGAAVGDDAPRAGLVLQHAVAGERGVRLAHHRHRGAAEPGDRRRRCCCWARR